MNGSLCNQQTVCCEGLVFSRGDKCVLSDVSFTLAAGTLTALIGHNGAGKSTLIKTLLGILKPAAGSVSVLGKAPGEDPLAVGYLPENVSFYDQMSVRAHLVYFARLKGVELERVDALLHELGLEEVSHHRLSQCSKGQRQRLGLAQALLSRPKLLILDEPTVGLDPSASGWMYRELSALTEAGCTVIVCTHELSLIEPYADNVLVMCRAHLIAQGTVPQLRLQCGLDAFVSNIDVDKCRAHPVLSGYVDGNVLRVPETACEKVVEVLTKELGIFGFDIRRAGLQEIFRALNARECNRETPS